MGIEGNIAKIYWKHLGQWLPQPGRFTKRIPLYPHDVQNLRVYGRNDLDKAELTGVKSTLIF